MKFSVVIPTLDEERHLGECIRCIQLADQSVEIIVADGGSSDQTREIANRHGCFVIKSYPGRGIQQNKGARVAGGDILLFLHADTLIPEDAFAILRKAFCDPAVCVRMFRSVFDNHHPVLAISSFFTRFETRFTSFGDQGLAIRKTFFESLGGFPELSLFEDVRFLQMARRETEVRKLEGTVITSARRFVNRGPLLQQMRNGVLLLSYFLGVSPEYLALRYAGGLAGIGSDCEVAGDALPRPGLVEAKKRDVQML